METKYSHSVNGQGVYESDLNLLGETSALADDRVFAELFRMVPNNGTPYRGILPTAFSPSGGVHTGVVTPGTGKIVARPFRAFIGTRTVESTDAKEYWRGIRSGLCVTGASIGQDLVPAGTDAGGSNTGARWDLVVAKIMPDKAASTTTRKVKDPTTGTVVTQNIAVTSSTEVTVELIRGTVGAGVPATPTDSGGAYYIDLTRIRVPASFNGSTVLSEANIWDVAKILTLSPTTGGSSCRPASINCEPNGDNIGSEAFSLAATDDFPRMYLAPTMSGAEQRMIALDFSKLTTGDIIDNSMDWRGRIFQVDVVAGAGKFPWNKDRGGSGGTDVAFGGQINSGAFEHQTLGASAQHTISHSFQTAVAGKYYLLLSNLSDLYAQFALYVDESTGQLLVSFSADPGPSKVFIWVNASGQFANRLPSGV